MKNKGKKNQSLLRTIKSIRLLKGYSQEYLAMKLNISQQAYQKLESGQTGLTKRKVEDICNCLELDISSFDESEHLPKLTSAGHSRSEKSNILNYLKEIQSQNQRIQKSISILMRALSSKS